MINLFQTLAKFISNTKLIQKHLLFRLPVRMALNISSSATGLT